MSSQRPSTRNQIEAAAATLRGGGVIALPTDTLYALAALASDAAAVGRVFAIKRRGPDKALPLLVSGIEMAARVAVLDDRARLLARRFWPGALTLVVKKSPSFDSLALAGGDTVALRAPDHPDALALLRLLEAPLTATSANRSGGTDPVTADDVREQLEGDVDLIIDAGACPAGVSSTIVDCSGDGLTLLRLGAIDGAAVREALAPSSSAPRR